VELESEEDIMGTSLVGTADDVIKGIQRYVDVNVRHFMLNFSVQSLMIW